MAKYANISLIDSEKLPDFEREAYVNFIIEDLKKENKKDGNNR